MRPSVRKQNWMLFGHPAWMVYAGSWSIACCSFEAAIFYATAVARRVSRETS